MVSSETDAIRQQGAILSQVHRERSVAASRFLDCKLSTVLAVTLFVFLLVENPLETVVPGVGYHDELLFFAMAALAVFKARSSAIAMSPHARRIVLCAMAMIPIGLVGNVIFEYQLSSEAILKDVLAFLKFPITFVAAMLVFRDTENALIMKSCAAISKCFILVCFVVGVANTLSPVDAFTHDFRNGIWSFKFVYSHPTFLVFSLVIAFVAISAVSKKLDAFKVMCLVVLVLTMRDKAIGFTGFVVVVMALNLGGRRRVFPFLLLAGAVVLAIVWPKIAEYMSYSNSPRESLYSAGFTLAWEGFPFGSGFASIACTLSGEYYSEAYHRFGMSDMSGLTPLSHAAAGDAGFAYYIGEFGFVGMILFSIILFQTIRWILHATPIGSSARSSAIYCVGYVVIALTVETVLTNATGVAMAIMMAFVLNYGTNAMPSENASQLEGE